MLTCLKPLVSQLNLFQHQAKPSLLVKLLQESNLSFESLKPLCVFNKTHYQRNKLAGSAWYDLWLICWRPGQASPIHDHSDSSCAFQVMTGVATEILYCNTHAEHVIRRDQRTYTIGMLCAAQEGDIHRILNDSSTDVMSTLHIYSPPLKMNYYVE